MDVVTWKDLVGDRSVDPEAAAKHLEFLFDAGDLVHVSAFRDKKPMKKYVSVLTIGGERDEQCASLREEGLDWISSGETDNPWNVYYSIAPGSEIVDGLSKRPSKKHAAGIRQLFADIDCKPGSFEDESEVREFIEGLTIAPSCVVWTGSGGAHLSWVIAPESRNEFFEDKKSAVKWWTWLMSQSGGRDIDRLIDSESRVLRLPGTVRWAKSGKAEKAARVVAEYYDTPPVTYEMFTEAVGPTFMEYEERVSRRRAEDEALREQMVDITERRGKWSTLVLMSLVDELADEYLGWEEILEGYGWTKFREGGDGSTEWTRPGTGASYKSATTDWPDSPNIMSLLSDSPETGLSDLKEAEIPLTKWRVFLRLIHDDNMWEALDDLGARAKSGM